MIAEIEIGEHVTMVLMLIVFVASLLFAFRD